MTPAVLAKYQSAAVKAAKKDGLAIRKVIVDAENGQVIISTEHEPEERTMDEIDWSAK